MLYTYKNLLISLLLLLLSACKEDQDQTYIYEGDLILTTQEEINQLGNASPRKVNGVLKILNSYSIVDLSPLSTIEEVSGLVIKSCHNLEDLDGLNQIKSIAGNLEINNSGKLKNLDGLNGSTNVAGNISIINCNSLKSIKGLNKIGGIFSGNIAIENNPQLESLNGLESIKEVRGDLSIVLNNQLNDLAGLENIVKIGGDLLVVDNKMLESINELAMLKVVSNLLIGGCHSLKIIDGPLNLVLIHGSISFNNNDSLKHITANFTDFNIPVLYINGNSSLESFDLKIGVSELTIIENNQLINLEGLELSKVSKIHIDRNENLTSLKGIENLDSEIEHLTITNNSKLLSLDALQNIPSISLSSNFSGIRISGNTSLNNLCGITEIAKSLILEEPSAYSFSITGNAHNPSLKEISEGLCSN
ncbi:hypothetical protein [Ekhidna sp.]|uniref:hypothetical protein n=1 Tax=Ekhidna sp. TaxID=2608089 RepID=UPI00351370A9